MQFAGNGQQAEDREASSKKPATVKAVTTHQKRVLQRRWKAIEPLTQSDLTPQENDYAARAAELQRDGKQISARTLRRYYQAWLQAGKDRMALVPKGDRTRRGGTRKTALLEKYPQIRKLVDEAIQSVYRTKARRPMSAVTRRVLEDLQRFLNSATQRDNSVRGRTHEANANRCIGRENARLPAAQAIPVPRQSALSRAIARRIGQLDPWEVDRQRWGRKIADRRHKPTSPQQMATRILQRVEIDHSPLKIVVGTDAGPIGQPWLSLLIDYYSRMVVGFCVIWVSDIRGLWMSDIRGLLPNATADASAVAMMFASTSLSENTDALVEVISTTVGPMANKSAFPPAMTAGAIKAS